MSVRSHARLILVLVLLALPVAFGWHNLNAAPAPQALLAQKCSFDGLNTIWTGKTQIVMGKIYYVMKCVNGHETLAESPS